MRQRQTYLNDVFLKKEIRQTDVVLANGIAYTIFPLCKSKRGRVKCESAQGISPCFYCLL